MPDIKSEDVETERDKIDHLASIINTELVKKHRTILSTTSLPNADSQGAEVRDATVHSTQRSKEELEAEVKTTGDNTFKNVQ